MRKGRITAGQIVLLIAVIFLFSLKAVAQDSRFSLDDLKKGELIFKEFYLDGPSDGPGIDHVAMYVMSLVLSLHRNQLQ